jgi:cytochrome bd-type quinol oxidase subunit 1
MTNSHQITYIVLAGETNYDWYTMQSNHCIIYNFVHVLVVHYYTLCNFLVGIYGLMLSDILHTDDLTIL